MARGDVHAINFNTAVGHEQRGRRYAVIVQSDALPWSTVLVCPTSTSARSTNFRPSVEIEAGPTLVMCDQVQSVDLTRLGKWVGTLTYDELREVDHALEFVLNLA